MKTIPSCQIWDVYACEKWRCYTAQFCWENNWQPKDMEIYQHYTLLPSKTHSLVLVTNTLKVFFLFISACTMWAGLSRPLHQESRSSNSTSSSWQIMVIFDSMPTPLHFPIVFFGLPAMYDIYIYVFEPSEFLFMDHHKPCECDPHSPWSLVEALQASETMGGRYHQERRKLLRASRWARNWTYGTRKIVSKSGKDKKWRETKDENILKCWLWGWTWSKTIAEVWI